MLLFGAHLPALVSRVWKVTLALITLHHRNLSVRLHCSHIVTTLFSKVRSPGHLGSAVLGFSVFQGS